MLRQRLRVHARGAIAKNKVTTSGPDGRYRLVLPSGLYDLLFEAEGYQPLTITAQEVKVGTITTLNVTLTAIPAP